MRFELKNPEVYHKHRKAKKTPFTRFSKSQPKPTPDPKTTPKPEKPQAAETESWLDAEKGSL
jgi:hypothetical protein